MKIIDHNAISDLCITPLQCYDWVCDCIIYKKSSLLPAKISLKPQIPGVFYNTMPAILPEQNWAGLKLVTRYPERTPSLDSQILLYDLASGEGLALLDGNWITAMRTGAVAANSMVLFAKDDFEVLGYIGLGNTARASLLVLLAVYPKRHFIVKLKTYKNQHILFADRFKDFCNVEFVYCDSYEDVVDNSDVIVSAATFFDNDICEDIYYKKGVLVVPIHTRGFMNCDLTFDKVFADDINHVRGFKYFNLYKSFGEVVDVVTHNCQGRANNDERILVYNIGIAIHDIYFAGKIYEMIGKDCQDYSLNAPTDKFWV